MNALPYFNHTNFINCVNAVDLTLMKHFADLLLEGDQSRVIYSSDAFALRRRSDLNRGSLNLPFINVRLNGYEKGDSLRWNARAKMGGVYVPELGAKLVYSPIGLSYEATMWVERMDDALLSVSEAFFDSDNKTLLKPTVSVGGQTVAFPAWLDYDGPDFDVQFDETDWLERNQINTIGLSCELQTFALRGNFDISITEEVLFDFVSYHSDKEAPSFEAAYRFFLDHTEGKVVPVID